MNNKTMCKILSNKDSKDVIYIGIYEVLNDLVDRIKFTKNVNDYEKYIRLFKEIYILYFNEKIYRFKGGDEKW